MNLNTGDLYWQTQFPNPPTYPSLEQDVECDVLILGGGEAGALSSYYLTRAGVDVVMVEKRKIGGGSTSGNTALLQYANDSPMYQLAESFTEEVAVRFYKLCLAAISQIEEITRTLDIPTDFERRESLYYASTPAHVKKLQAEFALQQKHGFPVQFLTEQDIRERFPFRKDCGLYSPADGQINPYRLAVSLVDDSARKGMRVYEQTEVSAVFHENDNGRLHFRTNTGSLITARKAVFATGYETQDRQTTPGAVIASTYAIATEPVADFSSWHNRCLIWETARPYLYLRTTADNRVLVGGLDETAIQGPKRDNLLSEKANQLLAELYSLFPQLSGVKIAHSWASAFGGTKDGLPFIGEHHHHPNCYYALGYGGNGTVYSTIAGQILCDLILGRPHADAAMFALGRLQ
ncbi:NAD(P)/FAD-dependent oxidoreductase [Tumebacillus permanentifrigoris]|uniref:Glycine/D-amino acid oxidase-like deaminating enzyme n=1 Tax=Tumebacillus permanentifrigoris TaxID=378543 RepID=A0A316D8I6_9BACL|nr:FAD-binding oxidoreductase [Tumebacillus permanentifrigoris]PWK12997.1 glycine/D-amino acid oxidase-like deaminating enzyme [Tumebacillus permanentifrigoris]